MSEKEPKCYLKDALNKNELVSTYLGVDGDRIIIWGEESLRYAGVYTRGDFVTEDEARETRPELFV